MKPLHIALLSMALTPPLPALAQGSVVVIAHRAVPVEKLDPSQATQIFLKQVQTWPDGKPIQPIDIKEGAPLRMEFYSKVTGRSPGQLRAYWARQAFTGMGFPPREVATAADVSKAVQATPGAIGYIDRKSAEGNVKVVLDPHSTP
ncbi:MULTISPECIES: phosphate ABC transporter substrate-binding protein [Giesbergeria]|uniref:Phosphate ABC transporter substrate-binding protein n=1 Tax=Giesbergeria sinuosa TaxID=80883 RepID=A0ABV9Q856_9BURK